MDDFPLDDDESNGENLRKISVERKLVLDPIQKFS